jgi:hypothetical protein
MSEVVGISIYVDNRSLLGLLGTMALHAETSPHQMEFQKGVCCLVFWVDGLICCGHKV